MSQKNALSECYWSHRALAQSQVAGTPCVWTLLCWSFPTKTNPDQAFQSHVYGKILVMILFYRYIFGTPCILFYLKLALYILFSFPFSILQVDGGGKIIYNYIWYDLIVLTSKLIASWRRRKSKRSTLDCRETNAAR